MANTNVDVQTLFLRGVGIIFLALALSYVFWGFDVIPEQVLSVGIGQLTAYIDDAVILLSAVIFNRNLWSKAKPKGEPINVPYLIVMILVWIWIIFYFFWGHDLIPDKIPIVGFLDDVANLFIFTKLLGRIKRGLKL